MPRWGLRSATGMTMLSLWGGREAGAAVAASPRGWRSRDAGGFKTLRPMQKAGSERANLGCLTG